MRLRKRPRPQTCIELVGITVDLVVVKMHEAMHSVCITDPSTTDMNVRVIS